MNTRTGYAGWMQGGMLWVAGSLVACAAGSSPSNPDAGNGQADAADPDTGGPDASDPDAGNVSATAFSILSACELPDPCVGQESYGQLADNSLFAARGTCVLEAMQERIAGTYLHVSNHTFGNGSRNIEHRFIVHADGSVTYAYRHVLNYSIGADAFEEITAPPAQRCQLQPTDYFAMCRNAVTAGDLSSQALRGCMYIEPTTSPIAWFTTCEPIDNSCE